MFVRIEYFGEITWEIIDFRNLLNEILVLVNFWENQGQHSLMLISSQIRFGLLSLFNSVSTLACYLKQKPSFYKNSSGTIQTTTGG